MQVLPFSSSKGWTHFTTAASPAPSDVGRSAGQANFGKLDWQNQQFLSRLSPEALFEQARPFLAEAAGHAVEATDGLLELLALLRERSTTLAEMAAQARWQLVDDEQIEIDPKAAKKHWKAASRPLLEGLIEELATVDPWEPATIEAAFEKVREANGDVGMGKLAQPVRVALTGSAASPGIFETVSVLPRERTVARLERALAQLPEPEAP